MLGADDRRRRADDAREASLKSVVEHLANVTERSQHIVRDEIELAKAEVAQKVGSIGRGVAIGGAAGVFIALGGLFFLQGLAWFFSYEFFDNNQIFWGFFMTAALLFLGAALAGLLAYKFVKKGAPPVPTMAIDEAKLIRESVQNAGARRPPEPQHGPSRTLGTPAARRSEASTSAVQKPVATVLPTSVDEPKSPSSAGGWTPETGVGGDAATSGGDAPKADAPKAGDPDPAAPEAETTGSDAAGTDAPGDGATDPTDTPKGGSDES